MYNNPRLSEKSLVYLYDSAYGADTAIYGGDDAKRLDNKRIDFIEKHGGKFQSVLDIGSGTGSFLGLLKSRGKDVFGIEPSSDLREVSRKVYGLQIMSGQLNEEFVKAHNRTYDLVSFNEVLEHVYNPMLFLKQAMCITNGLIYFDVPNSLRPRHWNIADFFSVEHLTHFTANSIRRMASSAGFQILALEEDEEDPILKVLLMKGTSAINSVQRQEIVEAQEIFGQYRERRQQFIERLKKKMEGVTEVVIYGAGHHTIQMFESRLLDGITIKGIVDSNSKKHGTAFMDFTVSSPEVLENCSVGVLISSFESQEDISTYLTNTFPHIQQIKLYKPTLEA